ncbi:hypothetical protein [Mycolicibacterium chlorophenolicum]|uniref:Reverse transcriptase (RNA-dependent DNA polymerase) n=1 Tax=Mycolicibacterium chlorophenolicum TaxID=37916 RepID=A0A0J6WM83_9MYCO|nr:hypothetical protein [Mycolicibacterium chlorophenolicum]KMO82847.1 Reverse transcriptase (RNA-dependent DNA polymerase) [Mycolicibacterium chlorophenolicum]
MAPEPVDIDRCMVDPATYESTILRIYTKRNEQGLGFHEIADGVSYFDAATDRKALARAIATSIAERTYRPQPVDLWFLETGGKRRTAHLAGFVDHVVGSALFAVLSHNARCYGLPGVYSYLPGVTNVGAMRAFAAHIRAHRERVGPRGGPLYVLQSDFEKYGDNLPVGPDAALWRTLREVASLGSGDISTGAWDLITQLVRPVVRDQDGTEFTRLNGVAMGTPLVPLLGNLAVVPMDRAISGLDGVFYARYNDDFLIAHSDLAAIHEADARVDRLVGELGVKRKLSKEVRTALSGHGRPCPVDPTYGGRDRIDCLGMSVTAAGTVTLGPHRLRRFVARMAARIDGCAPTVREMPVRDRARHLVAATNVMLDVTSPFSVAGLTAVLDTVTDRGSLKDLDYRIARKVAQAATGVPGVRGFRQLPPDVLYREFGLASLVAMRNAR